MDQRWLELAWVNDPQTWLYNFIQSVAVGLSSQLSTEFLEMSETSPPIKHQISQAATVQSVPFHLVFFSPLIVFLPDQNFSCSKYFGQFQNLQLSRFDKLQTFNSFHLLWTYLHWWHMNVWMNEDTLNWEGLTFWFLMKKYRNIWHWHCKDLTMSLVSHYQKYSQSIPHGLVLKLFHEGFPHNWWVTVCSERCLLSLLSPATAE